MRASQGRTTKLDIRLAPEAKARLSAAAGARAQSVSQFVLESALSRADETLADRPRFALDADQWGAFLAALDAPPAAAPRLARLFAEASPFEQAEAE